MFETLNSKAKEDCKEEDSPISLQSVCSSSAWPGLMKMNVSPDQFPMNGVLVQTTVTRWPLLSSAPESVVSGHTNIITGVFVPQM